MDAYSHLGLSKSCVMLHWRCLVLMSLSLQQCVIENCKDQSLREKSKWHEEGRQKNNGYFLLVRQWLACILYCCRQVWVLLVCFLFLWLINNPRDHLQVIGSYKAIGNGIIGRYGFVGIGVAFLEDVWYYGGRLRSFSCAQAMPNVSVHFLLPLRLI